MLRKLGATGFMLAMLCAWASAPAAAQKTELVVQYTQAAIFDPVFNRLKERFEATNPDIKVVYRGPLKDYGAGIQALLREAVTGGLPDIDYVGLSFTRVVAERDLAVGLTPLMKAEGSTFEAQGWTKSLQELGQVDGKQIGLPFAVSSSVVYYNADLVRQAGGDPANMPRDWDGLIALAGKIRALGPDMAGMYIPYTSAWFGAWYFQGVIYSAGGDIMHRGAATVALGEEPGRYAIKLYRRMVDQGGMLLLPDQAARQQFIAGKMGIFVDSIARLSNFEGAIGDRFELRTSPHPMRDLEKGGVVTGGNVAIITKGAAARPGVLKAAWKWLKFSSGPHGTTEVIRNVGYVPVNVLAMEDAALLKGYFDTRPRHRTAVDQIPRMREWFQFPGPNGVKIDDVIGKYLEAVVDKSMQPDDALHAMVTDVNALLPR
jgi:multiple sugar transport system substrate-binding protein